jgi:chitodextrinase
LCAVPGAPQNLHATNIASESVTISWSAPSSNGGATIVAYILKMATGGGAFQTVYNGSSLTFTVTGLIVNTQYQFQVTAVNSAGTSTFANKLASSRD